MPVAPELPSTSSFGNSLQNFVWSTCGCFFGFTFRHRSVYGRTTFSRRPVDVRSMSGRCPVYVRSTAGIRSLLRSVSRSILRAIFLLVFVRNTFGLNMFGTRWEYTQDVRDPLGTRSDVSRTTFEWNMFGTCSEHVRNMFGTFGTFGMFGTCSQPSAQRSGTTQPLGSSGV